MCIILCYMVNNIKKHHIHRTVKGQLFYYTLPNCTQQPPTGFAQSRGIIFVSLCAIPSKYFHAAYIGEKKTI